MKTLKFYPPKAPKKGLNTLFIKGLKPNPSGKEYEVADTGATSFLRVRVSTTSKRFYMSGRWERGSKSATARVIGEFSDEHYAGYYTLAQARQKAAEWEKLRKAGLDPRAVASEERQQQAPVPNDGAGLISFEHATFRLVANDYLESAAFKKQRKSVQVARSIRRDLLDAESNPWLDKQISKIDDADIAIVIAKIRDKPAPAQAYNVLGYVRQIFNHAVKPEKRNEYGLKFHPLAQVGPRAFGLKKNIRTVFLDNREIRAYWHAADRMGYPYGPYYQLLLIFALRLSDLSGARWSEFDWADRMFTVPDERHKSGADFLVPICDLAFEILSRLPGFNSPQKGDFLFSYYEGTSPINSFSKAKKTLDEFMLDELRAEAQEQGADPARVRVKRFVNHDTRRVVRSNLPRLGVADNVCELVIAHGKKGLARIYDQYKYSPQITQALQLWGEELRSIVGLPPFKPVDDK